jgi:ferritin-like protein
MSEYHEPYEELDPETRDAHRALKSLMEELEAVDWYNQRVKVCQDPLLRDVLAHNRDEEIEHACMTLEWIRRRMPGWDENLREYLFKEGPIRDPEGSERPASSRRDLGIGSLRPSSPARKG